MKTDKFEIDPYRILFPIGILCSLIGVFFWVFFQYRMINYYPRESHAHLMYFGFMWTFVAGFLMTAVPKMTSSHSTTIAELSFAILLSFVQLVLTLRNEISLSSHIVLIQLLFLMIFLIQRFIASRKIPFSGFVFIPMALLMGIAGALGNTYYTDRSLLLLLSGEAFILNLIIGLGSRLIPVISRMPNSLLPNQSGSTSDNFKTTVFLCCLFNLTYLIQLSEYKNPALIVRALIILYVLVRSFKVFEKPIKWTVIGVGLKLSSLLMPIGIILSSKYFSYNLAGAHLLYIGGFVLITLLISTRVVLAHGGESLEYEVSSKKVLSFIACLFFAAILRLFAGNNSTSFILLLSILFFIVAIGMWLIKLKSIECNYKNSTADQC